ncbi:MAG: hypothetical protein FWC16_10215 [Defluviitaleaceae bacterium]|nr:hypothetical protein [Defluviitaleaceae bacterium]MCL2275290.1 hypothetical protein [Defluviitaleaceae bacterium]
MEKVISQEEMASSFAKISSDEFSFTKEILEYFFPIWIGEKQKEEIVKNLTKEDTDLVFGMLQISSITQDDIDKAKEKSIYTQAQRLVMSIKQKELQSIENASCFYSQRLSETITNYENEIDKYLISVVPEKKAKQIANLRATGKDDVAQQVIDNITKSAGFKRAEQIDKLRKYVSILKSDCNFNIRLFTAEGININPSIADKIAYALCFPDFALRFEMHQILNNSSPVPYDWYLRRNLSIKEYERVIKGMGEDYDVFAKEQYDVACSRISRNANVPVLGIRKRKNLIMELISLLSKGHLESARIVSFVLIEGLLWQVANTVNKKEQFILSDDYKFSNLNGNEIQSTKIRDIVKQTVLSKYIDSDFIEHFCNELYAERNPVLHGGDQCHTCPKSGICLFGKILVLDYIIDKLIELYKDNIFRAWDDMPADVKQRLVDTALKKS